MRSTRRAAHHWIAASALLVLVLSPGSIIAGDQPAPPYPPYPPPPPRARPMPPPRAYPPPPVVAEPPPLSPVMRAIYAPFYVAGLVVRYGVYYVVVAPIEVFSRAVSYGVQGGVESRPRPRREDES
jgi:hypothetical protein